MSDHAMNDTVVCECSLSDKTTQAEELKAFIRKERDGRQVRKALTDKRLIRSGKSGGWRDKLPLEYSARISEKWQSTIQELGYPV